MNIFTTESRRTQRVSNVFPCFIMLCVLCVSVVNPIFLEILRYSQNLILSINRVLPNHAARAMSVSPFFTTFMPSRVSIETIST